MQRKVIVSELHHRNPAGRRNFYVMEHLLTILNPGDWERTRMVEESGPEQKKLKDYK